MILRILHIFLAISVFFSTTGLILVHHYCHEELKNIGVFVGFETCANLQNTNDCCRKITSDKSCQLPKDAEKPDCCDTKAVYLKSDFVTVALLEEKAEFVNLDFLKTFQKSKKLYSFNFPFQNLLFQHYHSPKIVRDYSIWFQSFLC